MTTDTRHMIQGEIDSKITFPFTTQFLNCMTKTNLIVSLQFAVSDRNPNNVLFKL